MAIIMLVGAIAVFSGCKKEAVDLPTDSNAAGNDTGVSSSVTDIELITNGESNYIIVYPEQPTAAESQSVSILKEKINKVTGVRMKSVSEEFMADEVGDMGIIWIGNTTFEPAIKAKEALPEFADSYAVDTDGTDIYFVAASDAALVEAAKYYAETLVEDNYDAETKTLFFESAHYNGGQAEADEFELKNIGVYTIIYADNGMSMKSVATDLQQTIKDRMGVALDVYKDTAVEKNDYEILVGETNRELSKKAYKDNSRIMEYELIVEGRTLQLAFGGFYSAKKCVETFSLQMLKNKDDVFEAGSYHKTELAPKTQALTAGADVRIMSANVLAYRWGEQDYTNILPVKERCEIFMGVLLNYQPDAVGVQETDDPWREVLPWYLERLKKDGVEYSYILDTATHEGKKMINFSSIIYRSDLYNLDESGCEVYSIWTLTPNYYQRVGSYAKFTAKSDPSKQFVLVNTHWAHEDRPTVDACATEQAELVNRLKEKYKGVNVFCTGDYNNLPTREWRDEYLNKLVANIGGSIASEVAKNSGVLIVNGGCRASAKNMNEAVVREPDHHFIDHIICSGGSYAIKRHDTILDNKTNILSDHSLIYADIDLK